MTQETYIKNLITILEDFDTNRSVDMQGYINRIIHQAQLFHTAGMEREKNKAVVDFLQQQLTRLK